MEDLQTERRVEYVDLDGIELAPRNPKQHDEDGLARSVGRHGMAELPLMDDRTGRLVAGHGRINDLRTRRAAGQAPPGGVRADGDRWLVPVIRGWASTSDTDAEAYLLYSNRSVELGGWDDTELAKILGDLSAADYELALLAGFDAPDLEEIFGRTPAGAVEPLVHDAVPATGATYAETPEAMAAREERIGAYQPRVASGAVEMILVYSHDDRTEVDRLLTDARGVLGADLRAGEIVLRALRALSVVLAARHDPRWGELAAAAGWDSAHDD